MQTNIPPFLINARKNGSRVTPYLIKLLWLNAVDRIDVKVATLVYRCLLDYAPPYLSSSLHCVADTRRLRSSADTNILLLPRSRLITTGIRSFSVAGPRASARYSIQIQHRRCRNSIDSLKLTVLFSCRYS